MKTNTSALFHNLLVYFLSFKCTSVVDLGCLSWTPNPDFYLSRIKNPTPGSRAQKAPDPGSARLLSYDACHRYRTLPEKAVKHRYSIKDLDLES
jgi:hypothetical protein